MLCATSGPFLYLLSPYANGIAQKRSHIWNFWHFTADCDSETRMTIACYLQYQFAGTIFASVQSQRSSFRYFCKIEMSKTIDITISLYGRGVKYITF